MLVNPIYLSNRNGIPRILTSSVTSTATAIKYTVPSNTMFGNFYNGLILLKIVQEAPTAGSSLPVYLTSANGGDQPITTEGGAPLTGANTNTGIHLAYYESNTGTLQIIA